MWSRLRVGTRSFSSNKLAIPTASSKRRGIPPLRPDKFDALSKSCFERIEHALAPLLPPENEDLSIERTSNPDTLVIAVPPKEFILKVIAKRQKVELVSPISGTRSYAFNSKTLRWEDDTDGHDLEGLLTRDFMRLCNGVPGF
ncbi:unnamed protein product [Aphanomyces euteiches]